MRWLSCGINMLAGTRQFGGAALGRGFWQRSDRRARLEGQLAAVADHDLLGALGAVERPTVLGRITLQLRDFVFRRWLAGQLG